VLKAQQQLTDASQIDRDLIIPGPLIKERACTLSSESHQRLEEKEHVKLIKHPSKWSLDQRRPSEAHQSFK
jgi:hypothetical protein